jgi:hypothetical protein
MNSPFSSTARAPHLPSCAHLLITVLAASVLWSGSAVGQQLLPMEGRDGWGYVDLAGAWVIEPQFQQATRFSEGRALVLEGRSWHFIDESGEHAMEHGFDSHGSSSSNDVRISWPGASFFSEGLAAAYLPFSGHAVIRPDGEIAFEFDGALQVGHPFTFRDGLAVAYSDRHDAGYIDTSGAWVIRPTFKRARSFSEGLAAVRDEETELWGYIDRSAEWMIEPRFTDAGDFSSGRAPVTYEGSGRAGYIDASGDVVIEGEFRRVLPFSSGLAMVSAEEGVHFIDADGTIAIDRSSLAPFCYTDSFVDGLALVVIATDDGCDYVSSSADGLTFVVVLEGLVGYIDTSGSVVVSQARADREAVTEKKRRAEQAVLDAETARLAACPDLVEYGTPGSGNYLVVHREGKRRVLHFERTAVHHSGDGAFTLTLPGFGRDDEYHFMTTNLSYALREQEDEAGAYQVGAHVLGLNSPRLDCLSIPESLLRQRQSRARISAFTLPGPNVSGHARGVISNPSRGEGEDGIEFHFDTRTFSGLDVTTLISGWHAGTTIEQASIVHDPTTRTLSIEIPGADEPVTYGLAAFDGEAGVHYQRLGPRLHIFDITRMDQGGATIDVYDLDITDFAEAEKTSFFSFGIEERLRERYAPEPERRVVSLVASSYVRSPHLPALAFTPVARPQPEARPIDDRDPEMRLAEAMFASMFSGRQPARLTIDDLPHHVNEGLRPPHAYDSSLRATGIPVTVTERSGPAEAGTWRISVEARVDEVEAEEPAGDEASDADIEQCRELESEMERMGQEATDEEAAIAEAVLLLMNAGFGADLGDPAEVAPELVFEAYFQQCAASFDRSLESNYQAMFGDYHAEMAAEMGVELTIDAATGAPLARKFSSKETRIEVEYLEGRVLITAENEAQGRHRTPFAVPAGILDIAQLNSVLTALPLREGYATELFFLVIRPGSTQSFELMPDGSGRSSTARIVEPGFVRIAVLVDRLVPASETVREQAYVVKVGVEPDAYGAWPLGIGTPMDDGGIGYVLYHIGKDSRSLLAIEFAEGSSVRPID